MGFQPDCWLNWQWRHWKLPCYEVSGSDLANIIAAEPCDYFFDLSEPSLAFRIDQIEMKKSRETINGLTKCYSTRRLHMAYSAVVSCMCIIILWDEQNWLFNKTWLLYMSSNQSKWSFSQKDCNNYGKKIYLIWFLNCPWAYIPL